MTESDAKKKFEMFMKAIHDEFEEAQNKAQKREEPDLDFDSKRMEPKEKEKGDE